MTAATDVAMGRPSPLPRILKGLGLALAALLILVLVTLAVFHEKAHRLYRVLTLFQPDRIVTNFQTMDTIFPHHIIRAPAAPSEFKRDIRPLPPNFVHNDRVYTTQGFLDETWTMALLVLHRDTLVFEEYYRGTTPSSRLISWSLAKSMVSALVGIAHGEGVIPSLATPVSDYVHMLKGSGYHDVPLKDVLQMSSGVRFNEDYGDFYSDINRMGRVFALGTSMDEFVLTLEPQREPGTYNHYVSMDTQVLGMVLRHTTGRPLYQYMEEKLHSRIGMESDAYWIKDNRDMEMAFGGLGLVARDYARFGLLYLNQGRYQGEEIVPSSWIDASLTMDGPHLVPGENPHSFWILGYGFQWWIPEGSQGEFMALGIYDQVIYVNPTREMVVVKLSAYPGNDRDGKERTLQGLSLFREIGRTTMGVPPE